MKASFVILATYTSFVSLTLGCAPDKQAGKGSVALSAKAVAGASLTLAHSNAFAATDQMQSFTPESFLVPVYNISLYGTYKKEGPELKDETGNQSVYSCKGSTDAECYVDLASQASLDKIASTTSVPEGTYTQLYARFSPGTNQGTIKIKGQVTVAGQLYYTSTDGLTTDAAKYDYTTVDISKSDLSFPLPVPLTVTDGSSMAVAVVANVTDIIYGGISITAVPSKLSKKNGDLLLSSADPALVPYLGGATPTIESYLVTLDQGENTMYPNPKGTILMVFDADDNLIGGFNRTYADGTTTGRGIAQFYGVIWNFQKNADGSFSLDNQMQNASSDNIYYKISAFQRAAHAGTVNLNGKDFTYTATKVD